MSAPLLLHVFNNFDTGGIQLRTVAWMNASAGRYRHRVVALDGSFSAADRLAPAVDAVLLRDVRGEGGLLARLSRIGRLIAAQQPDLLLTYNWGTVDVALANRWRGHAAHVHHEAGFGVDEAVRQLPRRVWFRRLALAGCRAVLVPSQSLERVAAGIWNLPTAQVRRVPDGIDIARFSALPDPAFLPGFTRRAGEMVVGTVTPLRPEKNLGRFLRLIQALRQRGLPVRGVIVGDGHERARLEAQAQAMGLGPYVHFAGFIGNPEKIYGLFDVFALTSETEQLPNGVLQAMAARRAIVGTDVGDMAVMVAGLNRPFIVPAADEAALCVAAARLLADANLRARVGAANHDHAAAHYRLEDMVAAFNRIYDEAITCAS